jgi:hypothetical protein
MSADRFVSLAEEGLEANEQSSFLMLSMSLRLDAAGEFGNSPSPKGRGWAAAGVFQPGRAG